MMRNKNQSKYSLIDKTYYKRWKFNWWEQYMYNNNRWYILLHHHPFDIQEDLDIVKINVKTIYLKKSTHI